MNVPADGVGGVSITRSGSISAIPWCATLASLVLVAVVARGFERAQVAVTWLIVASQLWAAAWSGLAGARLSSLHGSLAGAAASSALLACGGVSVFLGAEPLLSKVVLGTAFVASCQSALVSSALGSLREPRLFVLSSLFGYALAFGAGRGLARFGEVGLFAGFALGQASASFAALAALYRRSSAAAEVRFDFGRAQLELGALALLFNLGLWVDKLQVGSDPLTSRGAIEPLFLAHLSMLPGLFALLVRLERDFARQHAEFAAALSGEAPLNRIESLHVELTHAARRVLADITRVQAFALLVGILLAPALLRARGISEQHLPLFYAYAICAALQVLLLAVAGLLLQLDRRRTLCGLSLVLLVTSAGITRWLGPESYGVGAACALALTSVAGLIALGRAFPSLVQDSFMLRAVEP